MIFDKTGTLTYGEPRLVEQIVDASFERREALKLAGSLEQYSKHPLSTAVVDAARSEGLGLLQADRVEEHPGEGLRGSVDGRRVEITSRKKLLATDPMLGALVPASAGGLECVVLVDRRYAAAYRFRDEPRKEGPQFIGHLAAKHQFERVLLVSGDRKEEVEYLAERVGIFEVYASKSPEEKLAIVRAETARADTVYVGDGVNDAPAMTVATVGVAMGGRSEVTTEAAGAVVMDAMLSRVDELLHIGSRMRQIALQSAVGGMALSVAGMVFAAFGLLPPVAGAVAQEAIDLLAVVNALRAAQPPERLTDFGRQ
jgi:cation transport ATPase